MVHITLRQPQSRNITLEIHVQTVSRKRKVCGGGKGPSYAGKALASRPPRSSSAQRVPSAGSVLGPDRRGDRGAGAVRVEDKEFLALAGRSALTWTTNKPSQHHASGAGSAEACAQGRSRAGKGAGLSAASPPKEHAATSGKGCHLTPTFPYPSALPHKPPGRPASQSW